MKRIFCRGILSVFVLRIFIFSEAANAEEKPLPVVIVNQIRGGENCCQPGAADMVKILNATAEIKDLPFAWALRYDVLKDGELSKNFSEPAEKQTLGVLLEITPQLAADSGVTYHGDLAGADWHEARNSFLIGYSRSERQKLIDTAWAGFHRRFGSFPVFTVSWMIDSWSLQYLQQKYGIKVHELTKEQYETDGYTLYGGIFNQPYFPDMAYPLIPAPRAEALDVLVLRQTVSDAEKNYGTANSYFTSQPNDYLSSPDGQDFTYFTSLIGELNLQKSPGAVAVLGLENSQEWQTFQTEYIKQLKYVVAEQTAGRMQAVSPAALYQQLKTVPERATVLHSVSFPENGAMWYFGRSYRARIEIREGGIVLADYRVYSPLFADPYSTYPAEKSRAYWILPYLLDSSQQFHVVEKQMTAFTGDPVRTDQGVKGFGIELTALPITNFDIAEDTVTLSGETGKISLRPDELEVAGNVPGLTAPLDLNFTAILSQHTDQYFSFAKHPRFVMSPRGEGEIILGWENRQLDLVPLARVYKSGDSWILKPNTDLTQTQIDSLSHIFQPDRSTFPFEVSKSTFFWHNQEAIAGRSKVRLFIDPRNILDRPVAPKTLQYHLTGPDGITVSVPVDLQSHMEQFFVDFAASQSARSEVQLTVDGNIIGEATPIRFYADCAKEWFVCIQNTEEGKGFLQVFWREKQQEIIENAKNFVQTAQREIRNRREKVSTWLDGIRLNI